MSLNRLKESLRPCSNTRSSSSSSHQIPKSTRKPPKSSLSQQIKRIEELTFTAQNKHEDAGDDRRRCENYCVAQQHNAFETTGPYEPLVLSKNGEKPVVKVPASINCRLLEHQRIGVNFLYRLYKNNHGGVLGDDMGLGKTIQTIAFLAAVFGKDTEKEAREEACAQKSGPVLIVCPTSVICNWENEFSEWSDFNVAVYHGANRDLVIEKIGNQGVEIIITSFDTFRIHDKILCNVAWNIVIIDEAHRLKNEKSQLYKSIVGIKTSKRYGLTGTVMQNRIIELFNLFDWVAPGCLGTWEHFRDFYDEPLKQGQRLSAPERFIQIANERKKHLVTVLQKYMLRRTKEETIGHLLLGKEDNVVFCAMSELQKRVYKRMLEQPDIQCLINKDLPCSCGSPLTQVECCNRIVPNGIIWSYLHRENPEGCDSCPFCLVLPCLIKLQQISNHLELIKPNPKDDAKKQKKDAELASAVFGADIDLVGGSAQTESFMGLSDVEHCGKMRTLEKLLLLWTAKGDKILLFSYSVRMLDILEKFLVRRGYCFSRLDGSTPMTVRQSLVDDFNKSPSKQVFLISTRAGGLGLNLVSANRVVIFDPNWNPAQDLQAQDRSFRYGQKRHVIVLRLLAAGSLEELVYSRQIYKQQLTNIAVSGKMEKRYFQGVQDCKELQGELFGICNLFRDLSDKLFTSEIIEMHKEGERNATTCNEIDIPDLICPKMLTEKSQSNELCSTSSMAENYRKLHDLGIVYAHRNEDVVNMRPGFVVRNTTRGNHKDYCSETSMRLHCTNNFQVTNSCTTSKLPSEEQKKKEFHQIALYLGMDDLIFSNWVLSASPSKRIEMLEEYKKNKRKRQKGNIYY